MARKAITSFWSSLVFSETMYLWKALCLIFSTSMNSMNLSPFFATYLLQSSRACYTGIISSAIECISKIRPETDAMWSMLAKWSSLNLMSLSYSSQNMQDSDPMGHCRMVPLTPNLAAATVTGQLPKLNPQRITSSRGRPSHAKTISKSPHITSYPTLSTLDSPQPVKSNATYSALNLLVRAVMKRSESPRSEEFPWEQMMQGSRSPYSNFMGKSLITGTLWPSFSMISTCERQQSGAWYRIPSRWMALVPLILEMSQAG